MQEWICIHSPYSTESLVGDGEHRLGATVGAATRGHQSIASPAGGNLSTAFSLPLQDNKNIAKRCHISVLPLRGHKWHHYPGGIYHYVLVSIRAESWFLGESKGEGEIWRWLLWNSCSCVLLSTRINFLAGRREREDEWEWIIELTPSSGKCFIGFVSLWCWLSPWVSRPVSDHGGWGEGTGSLSLWLLRHVCNLLTTSAVPWSRGPDPGARTVVHPDRSEGTFYLLASFLKSSMTQPGPRQKKFTWPWLKQQTSGELRVRLLATLTSLIT